MREQPAARDSWRKVSWRFRLQPLPNPNRFEGESALDRIWLDLQLHHSGIRAVSPGEYHELDSELRDIEQIFLEWPELAPYWEECHRPVGHPASVGGGTSSPRLIHVAAFQVRLMEHAFIVLQLGVYPNAPGNRGWMNLFRSWGQSTQFNTLFDRALASTLSKAFVDFYTSHLRGCQGPIEDAPVPHPWDWEPGGAAGHRPAGGVFLDPGIREAEVEPLQDL